MECQLFSPFLNYYFYYFYFILRASNFLRQIFLGTGFVVRCFLRAFSLHIIAQNGHFPHAVSSRNQLERGTASAHQLMQFVELQLTLG